MCLCYKPPVDVSVSLVLTNCYQYHQCHLADYSRCEEQPPAAEPCFDPGNGILETCAIIRIFRNSTGELIDFRRSCSTTQESGCYRDLEGNRVCAEICFTDHCNAPHAACTRHPLHPTLITGAALLALWLRC
ncbi:uncharacterized protein LOC112568820 isoform X2 [Pomacea canaliculata]|uniref:uncharacterized protein LOC112568820 isoform X2 n=1 Tax=Pomacea canaliculata TaxID=400727 RepID=UPI000D734799|nr:uncharacterized protein LOC112568820 isoform X2 [Pomacea canaliculata]